MKIWKIVIVPPKERDRRRARFKWVYKIHAKTVAQAKAVLKEHPAALSLGATIVQITEVKDPIVAYDLFRIGAQEDVT